LVDTPGTSPSVTNPPDKNLMTYVHGGLAWPGGINIAAGTGFFARRQTKGGGPGRARPLPAPRCPPGAAPRARARVQAPAGARTGTTGGGTRWLTTTGNVVPGQIVELRIAIWDVDDDRLDSVALLDGFRWLQNPASPGTE